MNNLPIFDISIIIIYLAAMVAVGFYFSRKNKSTEQFTKASGKIPGWAIGLSIYATFLSSNTFLGVPGKAFGSNWNAFVFSISMPLAAWVASKYFVPFYRTTGDISAYTHLEKRFGPWARTYAVICFLLTQFARMGSIFFGIDICKMTDKVPCSFNTQNDQIRIKFFFDFLINTLKFFLYGFG